MDSKLKQDDKNSPKTLSPLPEEVSSKRLENFPNPLDRSAMANILNQSNPMDIIKGIFNSQGQSDMENKFNPPVLDANHPLMIKYQKDLKNHLLKLHEETDEQIHELNTAIQDQMKENNKTGKRNCELQKKMVDFKDIISTLDSDFEKMSKKKEHLVKKVKKIKEEHKSTNEKFEKERNTELALQQQIEDLALQIVQLRELQMESYSDSSNVKRATEKTTKQREELEIEKLRQDILITRMEGEKHNFIDRINLYKSQYAIKKEELGDLRNVIHSASSEMETIRLEKSKLMQQWQHSIEALEKRDKICSAMHDNVGKYEDEIITLNMDITNHKKLMRIELEKNEKLTWELLKINADVFHMETSINHSLDRQSELQHKHDLFKRIVHSSDIELEEIKHEKERKEQELIAKKNVLQELYEDFRKLEEERLKVLHEKIVITKATTQIEKSIKSTRTKCQELAKKCVLKEGEDAKLLLKILNVQTHLDATDKQMNKMKLDMKEQDDTIDKSKLEITKSHIEIDKKQAQLSDLDTRLLSLVSKAGGSELGPLQREIANYKKNILEYDVQRKKLEEEWLKCHREMVILTNETTDNFKEIEILRKKEAVLEENKIRLDGEVEKEEHEIAELLRSIDRTKRDIARITMLLFHEKEHEEKLQHETNIFKMDFHNTLKNTEIDFARKENEVKNLKNERKRLLLELVKAQEKAMVWEEKIRLAEETKKVLKSEEYAAEMETLYNEIKRLQLKIERIKKDEENLVQLLEKAALQHANLYIKGDLQLLRNANKPSKPYFLTKLERLKKKIKENKKKLEEHNEEVENKKKQLIEFKIEEEKHDTRLKEILNEIEKIDIDIEQKQREKRQNIIKLSYKHKRGKLLQLIKDGKYVRSIRNENLRLSEIQRLQENFFVLRGIVEKFMETYPELKGKLATVLDHIIVGLDM